MEKKNIVKVLGVAASIAAGIGAVVFLKNRNKGEITEVEEVESETENTEDEE